MSNNEPIFVGIGELLWDIFPDNGKVLGGAPSNFAYHAAQLGCNSVIVSRVGTDKLGTEALAQISNLGIATEHIQIDSSQPTGTVKVAINNNEPEYEIVENIAWDNIEWQGKLHALANHADVICFGTLAQRNKTSRETIIKFLKSVSEKTTIIFDVNLRQNFYDKKTIAKSMNIADIVKLNYDEFDKIMGMLYPGTDHTTWLAKDLLEDFGLKMLCITRGERGCILTTPCKTVELPGTDKSKVVDTVGAGDSFTAALAFHYIKGSPLQRTAQAAADYASYVVTHKGATPPVSKTLLKKVVTDHN